MDYNTSRSWNNQIIPNYMEQIHYGVVKNRSTKLEFHLRLWNQKYSLPPTASPYLEPKDYSSYTFTVSIHFNIILPPIPTHSKQSYSFLISY